MYANQPECTQLQGSWNESKMKLFLHGGTRMAKKKAKKKKVTKKKATKKKATKKKAKKKKK